MQQASRAVHGERGEGEGGKVSGSMCRAWLKVHGMWEELYDGMINGWHVELTG